MGTMINCLHLLRNRSFAIYLLATAACLVGYLTTSVPILIICTKLFFLTVIPLGVLESSQASFTSKWDIFGRSWGISSHFMVLSWYIIFICVSLICAIIWIILPFHETHEVHIVQNTDFLLLWVHLTCIAYLPIMYLLNPRKNAVGTVIFLAALGGTGLLNYFIFTLGVEGNLLLTVAVVAGLYVISATFSIIFDNIHRGRAT